MLTTLRDEIIDALKSKSWQTADQLRSEIGDKRNHEKRFYPLLEFVGNFCPRLALALSDRTPAPADILINLEALEEEGCLQCRDRVNPEAVLQRRGDRSGHEWNLA